MIFFGRNHHQHHHYHCHCNLHLLHSGFAIRHPTHRHALLHLCNHWDAGIICICIVKTVTWDWWKYLKFIKKLFFFIWNRPKNIFQVFGNIILNSDTEYNRHVHFQTFHQGLLVLFRWLNEGKGKCERLVSLSLSCHAQLISNNQCLCAFLAVRYELGKGLKAA